MLKLEIIVDRIFYPKNSTYVNPNQYTIFTANVVTVISGDYLSKRIKLKGKVNKSIKSGTALIVKTELVNTHAQYGDEYEIIEVESSIDFNDADDKKTFLSTIIAESTAEEIIKTVPNIIDILNNADIESLNKLKV